MGVLVVMPTVLYLLPCLLICTGYHAYCSIHRLLNELVKAEQIKELTIGPSIHPGLLKVHTFSFFSFLWLTVPQVNYDYLVPDTLHCPLIGTTLSHCLPTQEETLYSLFTTPEEEVTAYIQSAVDFGLKSKAASRSEDMDTGEDVEDPELEEVCPDSDNPVELFGHHLVVSVPGPTGLW